MRKPALLLWLQIVIMTSGCKFWPDELSGLQDSIAREVSGQATAWRVGGDVVVIDVANSPRYKETQAELEAIATGIAEETISFVEVPLASVSVTFHRGEVSDRPEDMRQFIFLVDNNRPLLQPLLANDATGPLTLEEVQALFARGDVSMSAERAACVSSEIEARASAAGDPETLDPATVESLPVDRWQQLDSFGRRLILAQAIWTKAFFACGKLGERQAGWGITSAGASGKERLILEGTPRFEVFESSNTAGPGRFASADGTVILSFLAVDGRYCRAARFSSDYSMVLACRTELGWEVEASSRLEPGESTTTSAFGGGDMTEVAAAIQTLNPRHRLLDANEVVKAARNGWR